MAGPAKISKEIEGDSPEMLAWGLLEWIRHVEDVRNRSGILGAFTDGLNAARSTGSAPATYDAGAASTSAQRLIAYRLTHLVAEMEGREVGQRNQGDRQWILETYAECLDAAMGRRKVTVAETTNAAEPLESA